MGSQSDVNQVHEGEGGGLGGATGFLGHPPKKGTTDSPINGGQASLLQPSTSEAQ